MSSNNTTVDTEKLTAEILEKLDQMPSKKAFLGSAVAFALMGCITLVAIIL